MIFLNEMAIFYLSQKYSRLFSAIVENCRESFYSDPLTPLRIEAPDRRSLFIVPLTATTIAVRVVDPHVVTPPIGWLRLRR